MILFTCRLMPAELRLRSDRGTQSQVHRPHFVWEQILRWNRPRLGNCSSKFISPVALCLGTRVSSLLTPEAANRCQLVLAAPSPDLFHQPHFVWEQESLPLLTPEAAIPCQCPSQLRRQIYFTSRTLSGKRDVSSILTPEAAQLLPTGPLAAPSPIYFTNRTLSGNRILRLSNGAMVGLTADAFPSSQCVLTVKRFRTTKCPL